MNVLGSKFGRNILYLCVGPLRMLLSISVSLCGVLRILLRPLRKPLRMLLSTSAGVPTDDALDLCGGPYGCEPKFFVLKMLRLTTTIILFWLKFQNCYIVLGELQR